MIEDLTRRRFMIATAKMTAAFRASGFFKSDGRTITLNSEYPPSMEYKPFPPAPTKIGRPGWYAEKPISMLVVNPKRPILTHDPDIVKLNPLHHNDFQTERLCAYIRQRQQDQITYYQILNLYYEAEVNDK